MKKYRTLRIGNERFTYLERIGLTFPEIGERLGIHVDTAKYHYEHALRNFRRYDTNMEIRRKNAMPINFALNRGELFLICEAMKVFISNHVNDPNLERHIAFAKAVLERTEGIYEIDCYYDKSKEIPTIEDLSYLTEQQKLAYTLRNEKKSYSKIAEVLGISGSLAKRRYIMAIQKIEDYKEFEKKTGGSKSPIKFTLARGELIVAYDALDELSYTDGYRYSWNRRIDEKEVIPYKRGCLDELQERIEKLHLYFEIV